MPSSCLIIYGADYARREHYLAGLIQADNRIQAAAIILEGIPAGQAILDQVPQVKSLQRLASGCFCCAGKLVFEVAIRHSLRQAPDFLALALNQASHLDLLRATLLSPDYASYLGQLDFLELSV